MGITESLTQAVLIPINAQISERGLAVVAAVGFASFIALAVVLNVLSQLLPQNPNEPPLVFHWFPILGNTISYGMDPYPFFFKCREKYGDIFTFILLGKKTTVYLGTAGNEFILNGKLKDVNAEEIYTKLTTPVFGTGVVYDCPNAKLMEQKKFVKVSLTTETFRSYVPLIVQEVTNFIKTSPAFKGPSGKTDLPAAMSEITIYTASRTLQGKEVRSRFNAVFANLFHDLDMGFTPINFMLHWAPLPQNRARDRAQRILSETYMEIIQERRAGNIPDENEHDLIRHLMAAVYKDGTPIPDKEISHMMIAMLMAGQHSSSSTSSWMMLNLAARPDIIEELYQEQLRVLGPDLPPLTYENFNKLTLNNAVLKETLRLHTPIHSILRKVKSPMPVPGTNFVIPTTHTLLSSAGVTARMEEYFPEPLKWDPHRWDAGAAGVQMGDIKEEHEDYGYGMISKGATSPYLPFGAGRHRCIGEQFASLQLGTIIATMVREFKWRLPDGVNEVVGTDYSSLFSRPLTPAMIVWEKREKN
ncbi:hypothetical protein V499_08514 [Pseudogymnoascus sp. VKM F-103]|uniref:Lanosterol 14-alpha-demethylase n=1 Tax=Pseudogymnoascus verrucosus TaxID=342668 RepID=A0A2P2SY15_9PEZI|nr:Lanosterol 14-alpha-demethylase [Pseudogymnoascus verrucosus]KFY71296.1 hypothetical protein V499_08514 [Pseudogymnoascus sp. VKM F-103]OBU01748.1 Lanosterol 14-alpha-demethylase [Pseudogymnoascus verrucosus]